MTCELCKIERKTYNGVCQHCIRKYGMVNASKMADEQKEKERQEYQEDKT